MKTEFVFNAWHYYDLSNMIYTQKIIADTPEDAIAFFYQQHEDNFLINLYVEVFTDDIFRRDESPIETFMLPRDLEFRSKKKNTLIITDELPPF